jgi:hypothetical protein
MVRDNPRPVTFWDNIRTVFFVFGGLFIIASGPYESGFLLRLGLLMVVAVPYWQMLADRGKD